MALTFLAGGIILTASHKLFALITWLPDNVLRWVGHSPHSLGEQESEGKIRAAFGGFVSGLQNSGRPMSHQKHQKPGGGAPGGDDGGTDKAKENKDRALGADTGTGTSV